MTVETIGQITALALVAALCAVVVKKQAPDVGLVLALCGVAIILGLTAGLITPVRALLDELGERAGVSPAVLALILKTVGIAILTRTTSELCRDAQEGGLASAVEIAGGACALAVCLPLIEAVLQLVLDLL